jgi:hypothetical protein
VFFNCALCVKLSSDFAQPAGFTVLSEVDDRLMIGVRGGCCDVLNAFGGFRR